MCTLSLGVAGWDNRDTSGDLLEPVAVADLLRRELKGCATMRALLTRLARGEPDGRSYWYADGGRLRPANPSDAARSSAIERQLCGVIDSGEIHDWWRQLRRWERLGEPVPDIWAESMALGRFSDLPDRPKVQRRCVLRAGRVLERRLEALLVAVVDDPRVDAGAAGLAARAQVAAEAADRKALSRVLKAMKLNSRQTGASRPRRTSAAGNTRAEVALQQARVAESLRKKVARARARGESGAEADVPYEKLLPGLPRQIAEAKLEVEMLRDGFPARVAFGRSCCATATASPPIPLQGGRG